MEEKDSILLIWKCPLPPEHIIPELIEWWLLNYNKDKDYQSSEISQIESVRVDDENNLFWQHTKVFTGIKTPELIISANTKVGTLVYCPTDENENLIIDPITNMFMTKTIYCPDILIYRLLPTKTVAHAREVNLLALLGKTL